MLRTALISSRRLIALVGIAALGCALLALSPINTAGAAEQTFEACPSDVSTWIETEAGPAYPPYATQSTDDASALIDCADSFTPSDEADGINVLATFTFAGLPTDPCYEVTEITVGTSGTPGTGGWPFLAYNTGTLDPITGLTGTGDGGFQQFNGQADTFAPYKDTEVYSYTDQPASGAYAVEYLLDPAQITLAELANDQLGLTINVVNFPNDVIDSVTASVTVDDANCTPTTTTTSTTVAPTVPATIAPVAQPAPVAVARPTFTG